MTPAEMLEPQPPPHRDSGSESVTDWLLGELPAEGQGGELVLELLTLRRERGIATYGRELETLNGRNATADALQEALDLLVYLAQDAMETGEAGVTLRVRLAYALVAELACDLDGWR